MLVLFSKRCPTSQSSTSKNSKKIKSCGIQKSKASFNQFQFFSLWKELHKIQNAVLRKLCSISSNRKESNTRTTTSYKMSTWDTGLETTTIGRLTRKYTFKGNWLVVWMPQNSSSPRRSFSLKFQRVVWPVQLSRNIKSWSKKTR